MIFVDFIMLILECIIAYFLFLFRWLQWKSKLMYILWQIRSRKQLETENSGTPRPAKPPPTGTVWKTIIYCIRYHRLSSFLLFVFCIFGTTPICHTNLLRRSYQILSLKWYFDWNICNNYIYFFYKTLWIILFLSHTIPKHLIWVFMFGNFYWTFFYSNKKLLYN